MKPSQTRKFAPLLPLWLAVLVLVLVGGVGVWTGLRAQPGTDITSLMSNDVGEGPSMVDLARQWGLTERVIIVIGPMEEGSDELIAAADAVVEEVGQVEGVGEVFATVDMDAARDAAGLMMTRGARLYRPKLDPIDREVVRSRLASLRERLASPEAMVLQEYLLADPLGMARGALGGLETAGAGMGTVVEKGHLFSQDRRYALVLAKLDFDPMEVLRSAVFVDLLDESLSRAAVGANVPVEKIVALGGVHFAASSSEVIMTDVKIAFGLTIAGVVLIFVMFFRRATILPAALVPGAIGIVTALGIMTASGVQLHALTLGFAAAITGISVDYAIHLLHHATYRASGERPERMVQAVRAVARPVIMGCATTVVAFALVATSSFPGMRQLAIFASISLPVALAATLLLLPAFHRIILGARPARPGIGDRFALLIARTGDVGASRRRRVLIIASFALLLALGLFLGSRAHLSGDPREMGNRDDALAQRDQLVKKLFPGMSTQAFLVTTGQTVDVALERNDALYETLLARGVEPDRILSLSSFLPSLATQELGLAAAGELLGDGKASGKQSFVEAGFADGFFEGLSEALKVDPIVVESYGGTSVGKLVEESVIHDGDRYHVLTRVRASDDQQLADLAGIAASQEGCHLASERLEAIRALENMVREIAIMLGIWLAAALVILGLVQRAPLFGLRAALPAVVGVICSVGFFALIGRPITPVASAGMALVMGLGIDYGIFMQRADPGDALLPAPAVLASAFTTLAAFGVLSCARTRAMSDLGLIILVGVGVAMITALILVPSLTPQRRRKESP